MSRVLTPQEVPHTKSSFPSLFVNLTFDAFYYNALALLKYADYHFEQIEENHINR